MRLVKFWLLIVVGICLSLVSITFGLLISLCLVVWGILTHDSHYTQYGANLAITIDQLGNVLLLGDPDETISSRLGRAMLSEKPKWFVPYFASLVNWIFRVVDGQQQHCQDAVESDELHSSEIWSWIKN